MTSEEDITVPTFKHAIATMSWIDPNSGLGKTDVDPGKNVTQVDIFHKQKCRFANFLEAEIITDSSGVSIGNGIITSRSGQYAGLSFASLKVREFATVKQVYPGAEGQPWKFVQTVGSRTESPENFAQGVGAVAGVFSTLLLGPLYAIAGGMAGAFVGDKSLSGLSGHAGKTLAALPPIWSTLELTMFPDGRYSARILKHSLFPSLTFYMPKSNDEAADGYLASGTAYDGVPQLADWVKEGWGNVRPLPKLKQSLAQAGNPWGITMQSK
jgi:hypothetical protein